MLRGEIHLAVFPTDPTGKTRPVLVVSHDLMNKNVNYQDVIVVKVTSLERADGTKKRVNPQTHVHVTLKKESIIVCSSIYTIKKTDLREHIETIERESLSEVDTNLKNCLGIKS